jgi:hypothetical protein
VRALALSGCWLQGKKRAEKEGKGGDSQLIFLLLLLLPFSIASLMPFILI